MREAAKCWTTRISLFSVWAGIVAAFLYKAHLVQSKLGEATGCDGCFYLPVARNDSILLGTMLLCYLGSLMGQPRALLRIALRVFLLGFFLVYCADLMVMAVFSMRLHLEDFGKYGTEIGAVWTFLTTQRKALGLGLLGQVLFLLGATVYSLVWFHFLVAGEKIRRRRQVALLALSVFLIALRFVPSSFSYAHAWAYRNVVELNMSVGVRRSYSPEFEAQLRSRFRDEPQCGEGAGRFPDIVVLVVESLSYHHSRLFSGIGNLTPNLDRIARQNTQFSNFHANGFSTEHGLIALISGVFPFPRVGRIEYGDATGFDGFPVEESLPWELRKAGYTSYFLSTGDLGFLDKRDWLEAVGFDVIEGHEAPAYDTWPRFHFRAAPDRALYERALELMEELNDGSPYLLVLETVSSHHPFLDPEGAEHTEARVMRYVDREIGRFYDLLEFRGFLDETLLIIVSDHRAMTPITAAENETLGLSAAARIPMTVVWKAGSLPPTITGDYQQVDLLPSLRSVVGERFCRSAFQGHFLLPDRRAARCILHLRGDHRDLVYVRCGPDEALVKMNGDRTRVVQGEIPAASRIVDKINHDRISR